MMDFKSRSLTIVGARIGPRPLLTPAASEGQGLNYEPGALPLPRLPVGGRPAAAHTPRATAERFLDAHYVRIALPAALEFTADLARHKVENEMRLVQGQTIDETTRKPSVHYRLLEEHPDG